TQLDTEDEKYLPHSLGNMRRIEIHEYPSLKYTLQKITPATTVTGVIR
ncbi:hypothetical protein EVA_17426, partial [gut metagenome]